MGSTHTVCTLKSHYLLVTIDIDNLVLRLIFDLIFEIDVDIEIFDSDI